MMVNDEHRAAITDVQVMLLKRHDRAVLLKRFAFAKDEADQPKWFPLSLVEIIDNADDSKTHTLTAPDWKLKQEGWL